ncbi:MAG TPA: glycosyltransferase family 39 protein [Terriglobales bacterium]|nr:glycosyltransferase family 39 protein [Terriglobales bacterium]
MNAPTPSRLARLAVLAIFLLIYAGGMFRPALFDDADSTHAEAAREMAMTGDWVTLHVNGIRYLEKAPLPYWLTALSYRAFGVSEFSTRLPMTLAVLLLVLLAGTWGRRAFGARAGAYAALFLATALGMYLFTRVQIPDVLLSLLIAATLYCFLTALEDGKSWRWYAGYAALALAVLTKGLVALVFVGLTAVIYAALSGDWRRWREFRLPTGLLLFFVLAAPWHILAGLRNTGGAGGHGFFWFYFVNEHFLRFLGKRYPRDYNKLPALAYWGLHLAWLFPWSLYLPLAVRRWRQDYRRGGGARPPLDFAGRSRLLCLVWAAVVLVFFAVSTNQEYYTFPAYLPLLLLLAAALARAEESGEGRGWILGGQWLLAMLGISAAAALGAGLWQSRHLPYVADIGSVLVERGVGHYTLSMSHFFDLTTASFAALRLPAALAAAALLLGPLASLWLRRNRRDWAATWMVALTAALLLAAAQIALVRFEPYLSSKPLADRIGQVAGPRDQVAIYGDQALGSSLLFYLRCPIRLVNGRTTSMWFGSTFPDAPPVFWDDDDLRRAWRSGERIFLFVPADRRTQADAALPAERHVIAESSGKVVYSNRP